MVESIVKEIRLTTPFTEIGEEIDTIYFGGRHAEYVNDPGTGNYPDGPR